ncbi:putative secreted protein [Wickerhamomyces ciferrii]|uniref:2-dehydropantoate 2-reductase n=1 Tax=Wickerhamomyces ciferrii (strain ATCC 14091 / BCRC 22168 / CBS 111 / JCM 3599 / NBRC 0793 / NRRL Y-1031 F-60-10) TaxID=1206466 RepID=K0KVV0_WICCF|nr:uncharacterized protein BN7_4835 [Wickerhamomyces ciferrii]CCH45253.1 putative secreted protein [Wickerhamomyces ciferrii]
MTRAHSVHVLGAGSMGVLVASELSKLPNGPSITLLLRNTAKVEHFKNVNKSTVHVQRLFKSPVEKAAYQFPAASANEINETIENLIITTKTYQTEAALKDYLPYLKPTSNILLIQNGLGVADQLYENVWPDVNQRPNIYQGVISHGGFIESNTGDEYVFSHAGFGDLKLAKFPRDTSITEEERYDKPEFIKNLEDAEGLATTTLSYSGLLLIQIKKFAVNACINPVTAIVNCINGELKSADNLRDLFNDIISEAIDVLVATNPLLRKNPNTEKILNKKDLLDYVVVCGTEWNANNSSSMRQDTLNDRDTEIEYINGFIVKVAEANGLKADVNKTIANLVKLRTALNRSKANK